MRVDLAQWFDLAQPAGIIYQHQLVCLPVTVKIYQVIILVIGEVIGEMHIIGVINALAAADANHLIATFKTFFSQCPADSRAGSRDKKLLAGHD